MSVLSLKDVSYRYEGTDKNVIIGITGNFEAGRVYTIVGRSGSGKSTLLSLIAGLDTCTSGVIEHNGTNLTKIDRDAYRSKEIGVVFQSYNLILNMTALENIVLAMNIGGRTEKDKKELALNLLNRVGIDKDTASRKILKLSGGEQQRVGIARAMANDPDIVIADEPTGNLDEQTEQEVLGILSNLAHVDQKCVIIVTHSKEVTEIADTVIRIKDGQVWQQP